MILQQILCKIKESKEKFQRNSEILLELSQIFGETQLKILKLSLKIVKLNKNFDKTAKYKISRSFNHSLNRQKKSLIRQKLKCLRFQRKVNED